MPRPTVAGPAVAAALLAELRAVHLLLVVGEALLLVCVVAAGSAVARQTAPSPSTITTLTTVTSTSTAYPVSPSSIFAIMYLPDGSNWTSSLSQNGALLSHPGFNADKNATVLFVPGFTVKPDSEGVRLAIKAFVDLHQQFNCVLLDWSHYSSRPYITAVHNCEQVALFVAAWLDGLRAAGLPAERLWLVGQSLGAHLAGKAASAMAVRPARITGLDPAGPLYYQGTPLTRLDRDQAAFVDVIHTDARGLGISTSAGHLDFWPNYGAKRQPGCHLGSCSHRRAVWYFAESVRNSTAFPAVLCPKREDFRAGLCPPENTTVAYMGLAAQPSAPQGSYVLRTASSSPFGLGEDGLLPDPTGSVRDVELAVEGPPSRRPWEYVED